MTAHHIDRAIEALARRQHGAFNRTQARDLGASTSLINRRRAAGRWLDIVRGVYALPGNPSTFQRQCMTAVLAEPTAWVMGNAAAFLYGIEGFRPGRIDIAVPSTGNHRNPLARVHRTDNFTPTVRSGIPIGTIEQTVCDLARTTRDEHLDRVVDQVLTQRLSTIDALDRRFSSLDPGTQLRLGHLGRAIGERGFAAYVPPTSMLEDALYRVLAHPSLPVSDRQPAFPWRPTSPQRPDALIGMWRLILEADGRAFHTRKADFARDRQRDRDALANGYRVARFTFDELVNQPQQVVDELLRIGGAFEDRSGSRSRNPDTAAR